MIARVRHIIGCMTGTSLDGLDAVLTRIDGVGLDMTATFVRMASRCFDDELRDSLRSLASAEPRRAEDFVRAARTLGEFHADVIGELVGDEGVDFVVAHGQTIFHAGDAHLSWQLFDPWPIVRRHKVPVCYDLRQADLVAGGQGAPITPIADWVMYREHADHVVNLGGIVNITSLDADATRVTGSDIGPCNLLIDGLCVRMCDRPIDTDGELSAKGKDFTDAMLCIADASTKVHGARSLGREQFDDAWLDRLAATLTDRDVCAADALRGAVESIANAITAHVAAGRDDTPIILAGGGTRNHTLVQAIRQRQQDTVLLSDDLGIPCEAREAMGFAVLGALSQDKVPITLPQVTGSTNPGHAGTWAYP